ncbi:MAG: menaquinone biosynthesis family protein [Nitrospirota bacterium]
MNTFTLGYSPCPNDTFIFYGLTHGKIPADFTVREILEDVEALNSRAMAFQPSAQSGLPGTETGLAALDLTKVSFHAAAYLLDNYCLLRSGGALGRGCGPLVVSKNYSDIADIKGRRIAIPGRYTTAQLLLMLYGRGFEDVAVMQFDKIMPAVADGSVDAGLIIHEGRFTYQNYGLKKLVDLGEWWEMETGSPIPLGCILAKRSLGKEKITAVEDAIRRSISYARENRAECTGYIKAHAQEMEDPVINGHISLYVNSFSDDFGEEGIRAIEKLFSLASEAGVIPAKRAPLFL